MGRRLVWKEIDNKQAICNRQKIQSIALSNKTKAHFTGNRETINLGVEV